MRRSLPRLCAVLACLLMTVSAFAYRPASQGRELAMADLWMLLGGGMLGAALWLVGTPEHDTRNKHTPYPVSRPTPVTRFQWMLTMVGAACLFVMAEGNGPRGDMSHPVQFGLWLAGTALVVGGLAGNDLRSIRKMRSVRTQQAASLQTHHRSLFLITFITLLAFFLRGAALENVFHGFVDEINFIEGIVKLQQPGYDVNLLTPFGPITSFTWIFPYLQTFSVEIVGPTLQGIRLVSAVMGTLTIPALYLLASTLFDRKTALLAALFLATFPPHIHFSRLGLNNIADPLFGTLALAFLARGLKSGRRAEYVLGGAFLGLAQYFYEGGKLVFPTLVVIWLIVVIIVRPAGYLPRDTGLWRGVIFFVLAALLVAAPLYYTLFIWRANFLPRIEAQSVDSNYWTGLLVADNGLGAVQTYFRQRLNPALLHYVHLPDGSAFFYGGGTALILPYLVPVFLLGIFQVIWRRRTAGVLLLLWLFLTAFGNSLIVRNTWSARFVVALPALALLMAVGIRYTLPLLASPLAARTRGAGFRQAALIGVIVGLALAQPVYYFGPHMAAFNRQLRPFKDYLDMMFRARDFPPGTQVFLLTDDLTYPPHIPVMQAFWHMNMDIQFMHPLELILPGLKTIKPGTDLAFFIEPEDRDTLAYLSGHFNLQGPQYSPYNVPRDRQYALYYVPARDNPP